MERDYSYHNKATTCVCLFTGSMVTVALHTPCHCLCMLVWWLCQVTQWPSRQPMQESPPLDTGTDNRSCYPFQEHEEDNEVIQWTATFFSSANRIVLRETDLLCRQSTQLSISLNLFAIQGGMVIYGAFLKTSSGMWHCAAVLVT